MNSLSVHHSHWFIQMLRRLSKLLPFMRLGSDDHVVLFTTFSYKMLTTIRAFLVFHLIIKWVHIANQNIYANQKTILMNGCANNFGIFHCLPMCIRYTTYVLLLSFSLSAKQKLFRMSSIFMDQFERKAWSM